MNPFLIIIVFSFSLPMKNDSTHLIPPAMKSSDLRRRHSRSLSPRRSTILMLQQFARTCRYMPGLPSSMGAFVAN